jgi:hypothetical protein
MNKKVFISKPSVAKIVIIALFLFSTSTNFAAIKTWTGGIGAGKSWNSAVNWGGAIPVSGDDIVFNTAGTITFSSAALPTDISFFNSLTILQGTIILPGSGVARSFIVGGNSGTDFALATGATLTIETGVSIYLNANATGTIDGALIIGSASKYSTDQLTNITTVSGSVSVRFQGNFICTSAAKLFFNSGSLYTHSKPDGLLPMATWHPASTCRLSYGPVNLSVTGFDQQFGNLTFQTGQDNIFYINGSLNIAGNLTIITTGSGSVSVKSDAGPRTINIGGNYVQTAGQFILNTGSGGVTMTVAGNFSLTNVPPRGFYFGNSSVNSSITVAGNVSITNGVLNLSHGENTGTFNIAGNLILSGGTITETSTGAGKGEVIFNGTTAQTFTPNGVLSNTVNFTVNNNAGVTLLGSTSFNGSLTLTNGILTIANGNTLIITTGNVIGGSGFGAARHIATPVNTSTGTQSFLRVNRMASSVAYLFPVGDGFNYLPVTLTPSNSPGKNKYGVCAFSGITTDGLPNGTPFTATEKDKCVDAVWSVNYFSNGGAPVAPGTNITLGWPATLEGAAFSLNSNALIGIAHYDVIPLPAWGLCVGSGDNVTNTATRNNITTFSPFFAGSIIPIPL